MLVTRSCPVTGRINAMHIDVSAYAYCKWERGDAYIQEAMPELSDDEREFILSGLTSEAWDALFQEEEY